MMKDLSIVTPVFRPNLKLKTKTYFILFCLLLLALSPHLSFADDDNSAHLDNAQSSLMTKVNVNTADAALLSSSLKGIGLKKAQAIIDYRNDFGAFQSIDELTAVKGIGPATIEKNAHLLSLN